MPCCVSGPFGRRPKEGDGAETPGVETPGVEAPSAQSASSTLVRCTLLFLFYTLDTRAMITDTHTDTHTLSGRVLHPSTG